MCIFSFPFILYFVCWLKYRISNFSLNMHASPNFILHFPCSLCEDDMEALCVETNRQVQVKNYEKIAIAAENHTFRCRQYGCIGVSLVKDNEKNFILLLLEKDNFLTKRGTKHKFVGFCY